MGLVIFKVLDNNCYVLTLHTWEIFEKFAYTKPDYKNLENVLGVKFETVNNSRQHIT